MILKGESAEEFNRKADENYEKMKARKAKQKQALIDMMAADEEYGVYEGMTEESESRARGEKIKEWAIIGVFVLCGLSLLGIIGLVLIL